MDVVKMVSEPGKTVRFRMIGAQDVNEDPIRMRLSNRSHIWRPPTDIYETDEALVVRLEIAGMDEAGFSIVLDGRYLLIRGARSEPSERRAYYQMEIPFGEFGVDIELPFPVVVAEIEAVYVNGFLRVVLPKDHPRVIRIEEE